MLVQTKYQFCFRFTVSEVKYCKTDFLLHTSKSRKIFEKKNAWKKSANQVSHDWLCTNLLPLVVEVAFILLTSGSWCKKISRVFVKMFFFLESIEQDCGLPAGLDMFFWFGDFSIFLFGLELAYSLNMWKVLLLNLFIYLLNSK